MKKILALVMIVAFSTVSAEAFSLSWSGKDKARASKQAEKLYRQALSAYGSASYVKAIDLAGQAIKADAGYAKAYALRGKAHKDTGDVDKALKDLDKAIALDPKMGEAYYVRAQAMEIMGEMDKAGADYKKACSAGYRQACQ